MALVIEVLSTKVTEVRKNIFYALVRAVMALDNHDALNTY